MILIENIRVARVATSKDITIMAQEMLARRIDKMLLNQFGITCDIKVLEGNLK